MSDFLFFEQTMKMFLGEKADQIAGVANNSKERRSFYYKAIKEIKKQIHNLDTTSEHKSCLFRLVDSFKKEIKGKDKPIWEIVDTCLRLCGQLMGHKIIVNDNANEHRVLNLSTPAYSRNEQQYVTNMIHKYGDIGDKLLCKQIQEDAISVRIRLVQQLIAEGFDHFNVGLILNISESQVKKLKKQAF